MKYIFVINKLHDRYEHAMFVAICCSFTCYALSFIPESFLTLMGV